MKNLYLILAGGEGSRMNFGNPFPKALLKVGGRSLLQRTIDHIVASDHGANIIISTRPEFYDRFEQEMQEIGNPNVIVFRNRYHHDSILSALQYSLQCYPKINIITLGDIYFQSNPFVEMVYNPFVNALVCNSFYRLPLYFDGIITVASNHSLRLYKKPKLVQLIGKKIASWSGLCMFDEYLLGDLEKYLASSPLSESLDDFIDFRMINLKRKYHSISQYEFVNINTVFDLKKAEQLYNQFNRDKHAKSYNN